MFQSSFLSDVINLYHMLLNDLVGPTGDMLDGDTLLNRIHNITYIGVSKSDKFTVNM